MVEIENEEIFGKVVAEALVAVDTNPVLPTWEKLRCVNAIAKAAFRIRQSGTFMDFNAAERTLLIWSDSNEIYDIRADNVCSCQAAQNGNMCWHRCAKRILEYYTIAETVAARIEYFQSEGWTVGAEQMAGV